MRKLLALVFVVVLGACNQIPHAWTEDGIREIAEDQADAAVSPLQSKISDLESKLETLTEETERLRDNQGLVASQSDAVAAQVARNAEISNDNAAREMTRRGACGTEWQQSSNGQWFSVNKTCTKADLGK